MKYPESCYQTGNKFICSELIVRTFIRYNINVVCFEMLNEDDDIDRFEREGVYKLHSLTSITAETLAELARENKDRLTLRLWDISHVIIEKSPMDMGGAWVRTKEEPLEEFFLRVAKERKYIK